MTTPVFPDNPYTKPAQTPPAFPDNPYADPRQAERQEASRIRSMVNGVQHSPDQAAEAVTLSKRTGVPADVALRNLEPLRQMTSAAEFDADTFVRDTPITARWVGRDTVNAAIAKDDFESLTGTERIFGRWRMPSAQDVVAGLAGGPAAGGRIFQQVQRGTLQAAAGAVPETIELSRLYANTSAADRRRPEVKAQIDAIRARMPQLPEADNIIEESARFALEGFAPSMAYIAGQAGVSALAGAAGAGAAGAVGGPLAGVTAGMGAVVGAGLGAYNAARELSDAQAAMTLEEVRDVNGKPLSDRTIDVGSTMFGLVGGALELGGYSLIGRQAVNSVTRIGAEAVAERAAKQAAANLLMQPTARRVATEVAKTIGTSVAVETGEEVAAEFALIGTEAVARIAGNMQGGEFGPVENVTERLLTTAYQTALGAVWLGGLGGAGVGIAGIQRVNQAKQDGEVLTALAEQAGMSKLRQRDPAKYEELVRLQTPEGLERVGVDAERLTVLLQEQSIPLAQFAEIAGIAEQDVTEALARGGDVYLPMPNVLARLVGTPVFDAMKMDLKLRVDGLSQREADEQAKTIEADMAEVRTEMEAIVQNGTEDASGQRVIDDVVAQITAAVAQAPNKEQFTPENIEQTARAIAAFFITTAQRTGQDAFALYQSRGYKIVGRETAEPLYNALVEAQKLEKSGKDPKRLAELRGTIAALRGTMSPEDVARMEQAAFHGTPYKFDKFSLDKIGTGEGAQAYGWGLYFAENEGIAEGYKKRLTQDVFKVADGAGFNPDNLENLNLRVTLRREGLDAAIERAKEILEPMPRSIGAEMAERDLVVLQDLKSRGGITANEGAIYRVDISDEAVARMLDWDTPLSEQAPEVQEALAKFGFVVDAKGMREFTDALANALSADEDTGPLPRQPLNMRGEAMYKAISRREGGDKNASLALLAAGIPGIKYLDAGSRTATWSYVFDADFNYWRAKAVGQIGPKFQTEAEAQSWVNEENRKIEEAQTRNLVVFDENLVTITHRNGEPVTAQERTDFLAQEAGMPEDVSERLVITHNLSVEKLRHALRMGGLPVPSLAVTKTKQPVEGFGEITLVGPREMADPRGPQRTRTFGADIYSPRYPSVTIQVDKPTANKIRDILKGFGTADEVKYIGPDLDDVMQNKAFVRYAADKLGTDEADVRSRYHDRRTVAEELLREVGAPGKIFQGFTYSGRRRYVAHTLENVVKILKKELRGGEGGLFGGGVGSLRAKFTPEFKSLKAIKNAKDLLVSKEKFESIREEVYDDLDAIATALKPFSPYPTDRLGYVDEVILTLEDAGKMGVARGLESAGFKGTTPEVQQLVAKYLTRLRNLPTEYFEAKILREVSISEFTAALVPEDAPADVVDALKAQGLEVRTYDKDAGRAPAIQSLAQEVGLDILLQAQAPSLPETLDIDGVSRPTRNSTGQPIHPTEQGVRNFWRWFGDSKVVDAEGRPLVVYHGTKAEQIDEFRPRSYFSVESAEASAYTGAFEMAQAAKERKRYKKVQANGSLDGRRVPYVGIFSDADPSVSDVWATDQGVVRFNGKVREVFSDVVINQDTFDDGINTVELMTEETDDADIVLAEVEDFIARNLGEVPEQSGTVYPVYLRITNPKDISAFEGNRFSTRIVPEQEAEALAESVRAEGFDGIVTESDDAAFFQGRSVTQYVVLDGESVKSAIANSGEFGPTANILRQGAGRPNAFIMQGVSQKTIALMNTANLSSLLHEFSHDWLEVLGDLSQGPNATEQTQADYAATLKYLGVTERSQIGVPEQEKFARSFERWLATAEAPSRGLARAFVRFKSWMQRIYRMAQEMLVPVDPEIADVFARMLATDAELVEAQARSGGTPMFTEADAEKLALSPDEMKGYAKAVLLRSAEESGRLLKSVLDDMKKEGTEQWQEEAEKVRAEVRRDLASQPVYQAFALLREVQNGQRVKLNREDFDLTFGPERWKRMPSGIFSTVAKAPFAKREGTDAEGITTVGTSADAVALAYGFRDGVALADALQAMVPLDEAVERETRAVMAQRFPDLEPMSQALADEADSVAHLENTDDVLVRELKMLGRVAGIRPPSVQAVKNVARQMLGKEQVKNIRPIVYQNAEAKAARLAGEAWKKGDAAKAAFHKRQQLLNHILYREAVKRIERSEVIRQFFKRMMTTPAQERLGKAGAAYQDGINALLESYGFGRVSLKELNKVQALNDYKATALDEALVVASVPASVTKQVAQINYRELTSDQLDDVYNMAQQIYQTAAKKDKALREEEKRTIDQMETDVIAQIEKNHTLSPRNIDTYPISLQGAKDMVAAVDAWHLAPEFLFTWLDGDTTGVTYRVFFEPIAQAEAEEFRRGEAAFAEMKKIEAMIELPSLVNDRSQKYDGIRTLMTKRAIIAVALNMGTQSGVEATLAARVDGVEQFGSYAAIQRMFAKALTEADWKYIQAKWDYANSFWPDIAELERETNGIVPRKLDAQQFTVETSDGKTILVNGGYYPLKYSGKLGIGDALKDYGKGLLTDEESIGAAGGARAQTQHGWTEERAKASGRPIDLSLNVWNAHIVNVIHDLTHRKAVRDVYRVYQRKGVRQAIEQSAGQELYNSLKPWLARVANPNQTLDNSFLENFTARARTGVTAVNMGLSVSVAMVQPLGYLQSADVIGANWMAKGIVAAYSPSWRSVAGAALGAAAYGSTLGPVGTVGGGLMGAFIGGLKKQTDFVLSQSVAMRQRREDYNRDMRDYVNARKGKMSNFEQYYFAFIGMMDNAVMVPTWIGGYRKAFAENGGNHDAAVQFADSAVRRSQGAGSPKDLSRVQGGPEFRRILTIHYSFLSRQYGLMRRSATNVKEGRWTKARVLASMSALVVLSPILAELAAGRPPEDDEDWLTWAIVQTLRGAAGAVVGLRDLARALGPDAFPYKISPVEDVFKKSVGALQTLGESVFEEDFELSESELKEIVETVGYWGRLPTRAVWRAVTEFDKWMQGYDVEPADFIRTAPRQ